MREGRSVFTLLSVKENLLNLHFPSAQELVKADASHVSACKPPAGPRSEVLGCAWQHWRVVALPGGHVLCHPTWPSNTTMSTWGPGSPRRAQAQPRGPQGQGSGWQCISTC